MVNAALYYRKFLELAKPGDRRIDNAKAKLVEMERFDVLTIEGGTAK